MKKSGLESSSFSAENWFWFRLSDRFFKLKLSTQIFLYFIIIFIAAIFSEGWLQPDEHARVLEPAHFLAYGYATLPWEMSGNHPIVSFVLASLHAPILFVTKIFHLNGIHEAAILRFFAGCFNAARVPLLFLILGVTGINRRVQYFVTFLFAFGVFGPLLMVRTSQEGYATTLSMFVVYLLLKACRDSHLDFLSWNKVKQSCGRLQMHSLQILLCFAALALAVSFRLQLGISAAFFGLYVLYLLPPRKWFFVVLGVAVGLIPVVVVDTLTFGKPLLPAWNYFRYAISNEGGGMLWGTEPWYWYIKEYFLTWFPPISPLLLPFLAVGIARIPIVCLMMVPFFAVHCVLGHKEVRYLHPLMPWAFVATAYGFNEFTQKFHLFYKELQSKKWFWKTASVLMVLYLIVGLASILIQPNSSPRLYEKIRKLSNEGEVSDGLLYVGNTMTSVSQFYVKNPNLHVKKYEINEYLDLVERKNFVPGIKLHAFYAVEGEDLERMLKVCRLNFVARNIRLKRIFDNLPVWIRQPRYYGILDCPGSFDK